MIFTNHFSTKANDDQPTNQPKEKTMNYSSKMELINANPNLAYQILISTAEMDKIYMEEYNFLLNSALRNGRVYTTKLGMEISNVVLSRMCLAGLLNK